MSSMVPSKICVGLILTALVFCEGCGTKTGGNSKTDSASKAAKAGRHPMEQHLIGKWRGPVEFNEQAFVKALKNRGATQQRVDALLSKRDSFNSEVTFTRNGGFGNLVVIGNEVLLPGDIDAPWRILKSTNNELVIQTHEGADADQWIAEFADKDNLFLKAPAPESDGIIGYRLKRVE